MSIKETRAVLALLREAPGPWVLATLVQVEGSSYRRVGARLLLSSDGRSAGSISGGCLEDDIRAHARQVQASGIPQTVVYDTTRENDLVWGVGLGCHGVVRVLLERLPASPSWATALEENLAQLRSTELAITWAGGEPSAWGTRLASPADAPAHPDRQVFRQTVGAPVRLLICGAGDDAIPLTRFAHELGWHVTVCDPRPAFATAARFPVADEVFVGDPEAIGRRFAGPAPTAVVVMTHHYLFDRPLLQAFLPRPLPYLGLLGPRRRAEKILEEVARAGVPVTAADRARLRAPIGLDLGSDNPEEVALSIVAEIRAVLEGRDGRPLRERTLPIHG